MSEAVTEDASWADWKEKPGQAAPMPHHYPIRTWQVPGEPEAVTVDIVEMSRRPEGGDPRTGGETMHVPTHVVINGRPVYTPRNTTIKVEACGLDATTVTLTFFARRVRIGHADELLADDTAQPGQE